MSLKMVCLENIWLLSSKGQNWKFFIEKFACPKRRFLWNCLSKREVGRVLAKSMVVDGRPTSPDWYRNLELCLSSPFCHNEDHDVRLANRPFYSTCNCWKGLIARSQVLLLFPTCLQGHRSGVFVPVVHGLSLDLETGCPKLAIVEILGVQILKGDHNILRFQP